MKKLRFFDSLKFVLATVACMFAIMPAHAATLPAGYTELEYLESTAIPSQAYINTGLNFNSNYIYEINFLQSNVYNWIMGAAIEAYNKKGAFILTYCNDKVCFYSSTTSASSPSIYSGLTLPNNVRHTAKYQQSTKTALLDDRNVWAASWITDENIPYNVFLFAYNIAGNVDGRRSGYLRIYSYRVKDADGVLIQNFVPARRDSDGMLGMYDLEDSNPETAFHTNAGTGEFVAGEYQIKIATTKYSEAQFAPVETRLDAAVAAVDTVVTQTMSQAQQIDQIATNKQTRPDETCPPFKKCLLVEDEDGTPHWYEIYDPINDFLNPILAAAGLSGNQGAPTQTTHTENGSTLYDTSNVFYNGSGAFRKKYIDNKQLAVDRPFGPTTLARCADNATRTTSTVNAGICYDTGGMFRELTEGSDDDSGEWAVVYNGNEGGASLGITPGVVYGVAKCTTVGRHTTEMTGDVADGSNYWWPKKLTAYSGDGITLASLISDYPNSNVETVFNTLPSEYGTDEKPGYPRDNFQNCWCKMTAIGVPGSGENDDQRYANGTIMSVSGGWVFGSAFASVADCVYNCAYYCGLNVQRFAIVRRNVLTVK